MKYPYETLMKSSNPLTVSRRPKPKAYGACIDRKWFEVGVGETEGLLLAAVSTAQTPKCY